MKRFKYALLLLPFLLLACSKSKMPSPEERIVGKWVLSARQSSNGSPEFVYLEQQTRFYEFKSNGVFKIIDTKPIYREGNGNYFFRDSNRLLSFVTLQNDMRDTTGLYYYEFRDKDKLFMINSSIYSLVPSGFLLQKIEDTATK